MRRLALVGGLSISILAAASARGDDPPRPRRPAAGSPAVARLAARSRVEARIARVRLVHQGAAALPALARGLKSKQITAAQVRPVVSAMLVETVTLPALKRYPKLLALLDADVAAARKTAAPLFAAKRYDSGDRGLVAKPPPLVPVRAAIKTLTSRGGAAVRVALELLDAPGAPQRAFGAELLFRLQAVGQRAAFQRPHDQAKVFVSYGCTSENVPIAELTRRWLRCQPFTPGKGPGQVCIAAERYLRWAVPQLDPVARNRLLNRLRQKARTFAATSFDDYWRRARPILRQALGS